MAEQETSQHRLLVGDYAMTNFNGKAQRVRIVERVSTPQSQSGYSFRVQAIGGRAMRDHYDAAWFWPEAQSNG